MVATSHHHRNEFDLFNESLDLTSTIKSTKKDNGINISKKATNDKCKGRKSPPKNKKKQKRSSKKRLSVDQLASPSSTLDTCAW